MKLFLGIAAGLAWLFGAALVFAPEQFYAPTGVVMTPLVATIAQAHGATLLGVGVMDWLARTADRQGQRAALAGTLLTQVVALFVVIRTMTLGAGMQVAPGLLIHLVFGALCARFLWSLSRMPAQPAT